MKKIFDEVSVACSRITTKSYSTSFSLGIYCLDRSLHNAIYSIYGFVRFADEIVDTFHDYNKQELFYEFKAQTATAIAQKISMNPILNSFQDVVHKYNIGPELIDGFMKSMETDLNKSAHSTDSYSEYIVGSAEVVGLMCLRVFTGGDDALYQKLEIPARRLGAAFQKVNFLRDLKDDYEYLGRVYFPGVAFGSFSESDKKQIEKDIDEDFREAYKGLKQLPKSSRFGVYVAYVYYRSLFNKIRKTDPARILKERVRIPNHQKLGLLIASYFRYSISI